MQEQPGASPLEELLEAPDWPTFYRSYVRRNRPVVLRGGAASQRGFARWTDDYLREHWGGRMVNVELNKSETRGGPTSKMRFSNFLEEIYKPEREGQLYAIVDFDGDMVAKADFSLPPPIRCKEIFPQSLTLWISAGGTTSVLHEDDGENMLLLLAGRKTVMLVHQDEAQNMYARIADHSGSSPVHQDAVDLVAFPKFANLSWISGELAAGDMLYIPHTYWHQVNSFERNLAVNLWWQHEDDWRWWDPDAKEYDATRFGSEGWAPFEKLKSRAAMKTKCTPLAPEVDLSKTKFLTDEAFRKYAVKKRAQAKKKGEL